MEILNKSSLTELGTIVHNRRGYMVQNPGAKTLAGILNAHTFGVTK